MSATFFSIEELGLRTDDDAYKASVYADDEAENEPCVLEINDFATLAELQPLWRELFDNTPHPVFSQTFEWLQLYWQHFGEQLRLRAFCLDEGGQTVGLTVLVESDVSGRNELTLPNVGGETFWPLGAKPAEQWHAIARHLRTELARNQVLDLRGLSDPHGKINSAWRVAGANFESQPWSSTTTLSCRENFETYWSRVAPEVRSLIETGEQRLAKLGPMNFVRFRPQGTDRTGPHFPEELYQDCLGIALNDEQQLLRPDSVLNVPEQHLFLGDLLPWAWRHSAADLCLLLSGSRPIAFRFHTREFGHLRTVWSGVDAEFRQLPLAALLLFRTLRDSTQRGDAAIDLGPTPAKVARNWGGTLTPHQRFIVGTSGATSVPEPPEEWKLYDV